MRSVWFLVAVSLALSGVSPPGLLRFDERSPSAGWQAIETEPLPAAVLPRGESGPGMWSGGLKPRLLIPGESERVGSWALRGDAAPRASAVRQSTSTLAALHVRLQV